MENLILSSSNIVGTDVKNRRGDNLGTIKDVVIDMEAGRVAYLILASGGFLGIGNKYLALPLETIEIDTVDEKIIVDIDKAKLQSAPGFENESWTSQSQRELVSNIYSYYGLDSYLRNSPLETVEIHSEEAFENKEERSWNPNNENEETTYRSNFRESFPDSGTRNRDLDPDRNRNIY
jgi:sporulation protein YlmC with PRC-barrel domain